MPRKDLGAVLGHFRRRSRSNVAKERTVDKTADDEQANSAIASESSTADNLQQAQSNLSSQLWDEAYDKIDAGLTKIFEEIVKEELKSGYGVQDTQKGLLSPEQRRSQMTLLATRRYQKAAKHKAAESGLFAVEMVDKFKDTIASSLSAYPPAALAFSGVTLLLDCVGGSLKARKANLDGLKYVIARHEWYLSLANLLLQKHAALNDANIAAITATIRKSVLALYTSLLQYQMKSVCSYYGLLRRFSTFFKDQTSLNDWTGDISEIKTAEAALYEDAKIFDMQLGLAFQSKESEYWAGLCNDFAELLAFEARKEIRDQDREQRELKSEKRELEKQTQEQKTVVRNFISKFRVPGLIYEDFKDLPNPKPAPDTCRWIKKDPRYLEWRQADTGLLVVSAPPGCGKSTLARSIVDDMQDQKDETDIVCYFFFKDSNIQGLATNALCALLHQALLQMPQVALELAEKDVEVSSLVTLWKMFVQVAESSGSRRVVCILDALDECNKKSRDDLIARFKERANDCPLPFKLLITTRPEESILLPLRILQPRSISLETGDEEIVKISAEIDIFIDYKLGELAKRQELSLTPDVLKELQSSLKGQENRTYLWVRLIFEILEDNWVKRSRSGWLSLVQNVPGTLDTTYEALLQKIPSERLGTVRVILSIMVASFRPLRVDELMQAFATHLEVEKINEESLSDSVLSELDEEEEKEENSDLISDPEVFTTWLTNTCGFIVQVFGGNVVFVHQTVKEFLMSTKGKHAAKGAVDGWKSSIPSCSAHRIFGEICIAYASQPEFFQKQTTIPRFQKTTYEDWVLLSVGEIAEGIDSDRMMNDLRSGGSGYFGDEYHIHFRAILERFYMKYPLLEYCYAWWADHVRLGQEIDEHNNTLFSVKNYCYSTSQKYADLIYKRNLMHYQSWVTPYVSNRNGQAMKLPQFWRDCEYNRRPGKVQLAGETGHFNLINEVLEQRLDEENDSAMWLMLKLALFNDFIDVVKYLSRHPRRPDFREYGPDLLLHCCSAQAALVLRNHGADLDATNKETGDTILHRLCRQQGSDKTLAAVRGLLKIGAKPNIPNRQGQTSLHGCTSPNIVKVLLEAKADVEAKDSFGNTPLHIAAKCGRNSIVRALLSAGANSSAQNSEGQTPIHLVIDSNESEDPSAMIHMLLESGASFDIQDFAGNTSLHKAAQSTEKYHSGFITQVQRLKLALSLTSIDARNATNSQGETALHLANSEDKVIALIEAGLSINARDNAGATPLHAAVERYDFCSSRALLLNGAQINCRDKWMETPLHLCREPALAALLLAAGCDVNARDANGYTALHRMVRDSTDMAAIQYDWNEDSTLPDFPEDGLILAPTETDWWDPIREPFWRDVDEWLMNFHSRDISLLLEPLLDCQATVNTQANDGFYPIHHAALGSVEAVAFLVDAGADLSVTTPLNKTPLELVLAADDDDPEKWLKFSFLASAENANGLGHKVSPLQHVCSAAAGRANPQDRIVLTALERLINAGADPNQCIDGDLPLYILLTRSRHSESIDSYQYHEDTLYAFPEDAHLLLEHNADPNAEDLDGVPMMLRLMDLVKKTVDSASSGAGRHERCCAFHPWNFAFTLGPILHCGFNLDQVDSDGNSFLHIACGDDCLQSTSSTCWQPDNLYPLASFVSQLLDNHADPNLQNHQGETPFFVLCKTQLCPGSRIVSHYYVTLFLIASSLLACGADPWLPASCGCTALDVIDRSTGASCTLHQRVVQSGESAEHRISEVLSKAGSSSSVDTQEGAQDDADPDPDHVVELHSPEYALDLSPDDAVKNTAETDHLIYTHKPNLPRTFKLFPVPDLGSLSWHGTSYADLLEQVGICDAPRLHSSAYMSEREVFRMVKEEFFRIYFGRGESMTGDAENSE